MDTEQQMRNQIRSYMKSQKLRQTDFAKSRGQKIQSVNKIFTGERGMLTGTTLELLDWLGLEVKLVPSASVAAGDGVPKPDPEPIDPLTALDKEAKLA